MRGLGEKFKTTLRAATKNKIDPITKTIFKHYLKEFRKKEKRKMPGNTIKINNREELSWYLGDSKMDDLIGWLNDQGIKEPEKDVEVVTPNIDNFFFSKSDNSDSSEPEETKMKTKMAMLNDWLDELIFPGETSDFIQEAGVEEPPYHEIKRKIYLYTTDHKYMIVAIDRENNNGYLGCQVSNRKHRAGEDWVRGNDLSDGAFNKDTWNSILNSIIRYEIVKLTTYKRPETKPEIAG
jgi:hypothetical protein